jgi:hypothetical protein
VHVLDYSSTTLRRWQSREQAELYRELYKLEMDFLGHRLTQDGLARQAAKVEAIQQWAMPTTQAEVRSFISVIGYYHSFVDGFAGVS